jgi:hypothetical protein
MPENAVAHRFRIVCEAMDPANPGDARRAFDPAQEETLIRLVKRLYAQSNRQDPESFQEQRRFQRMPFHRVVTLTPCPTLEEPKLHDAEPVVAKDISGGGLCFVHSRQPPHKQILITLSEEDLIPVCMLAEVKYVLPTAQGMYLIGVQFKQRVHLAIEGVLDE